MWGWRGRGEKGRQAGKALPFPIASGGRICSQKGYRAAAQFLAPHARETPAHPCPQPPIQSKAKANASKLHQTPSLPLLPPELHPRDVRKVALVFMEKGD